MPSSTSFSPTTTPVLEFVLLRLRSPHTSPTSSLLTTLLPILCSIRSQLGTSSKFYTCVEDPSLIYIFGLWPSLTAHKEFLSSSESTTILAPQNELLEFVWQIHVAFAGLKEHGMEILPLKAPVMAFARLWIMPDEERKFEEKSERQKGEIIDAAGGRWSDDGNGVVYAWRFDDIVEVKDGESENEMVMMTGWESKDAHDAFRERVRQDNPEYKSLRDHYVGMEVRHLRDLEDEKSWSWG